jgi:hypothetical protein
LTHAANPLLGLGSLNGNVLNLLVFKLYSSISPVLYPSANLPPNNRILDFEIGTAENFVLALLI